MESIPIIIVSGMIGLFIGAAVLYFFAMLVGIEDVTYGRAVKCGFLLLIALFVVDFVFIAAFAMFESEPPDLLLLPFHWVLFVACTSIAFDTTIKKGVILSIVLFIANLAFEACLTTGGGG